MITTPNYLPDNANKRKTLRNFSVAPSLKETQESLFINRFHENESESRNGIYLKHQNKMATALYQTEILDFSG